MSSVVLERECLICACASFTSAPGIFSQVACDVRRLLQFTHGSPKTRQRARELANTPECTRAQRQRKKVEALFAELKNQIGLRRLRLRRLKFVREQFFLAAAAQNLKRLVRFLSQLTRLTQEVTA